MSRSAVMAAIANRVPHIVTPRRVNASALMIMLNSAWGAANCAGCYRNPCAQALRRSVALSTHPIRFTLKKFDFLDPSAADRRSLSTFTQLMAELVGLATAVRAD